MNGKGTNLAKSRPVRNDDAAKIGSAPGREDAGKPRRGRRKSVKKLPRFIRSHGAMTLKHSPSRPIGEQGQVASHESDRWLQLHGSQAQGHRGHILYLHFQENVVLRAG